MRVSISRLLNIILALWITVSVIPAENRMPGSDDDFRPGHLLLLVNDGYVPTVRSLLPDVPFADQKAYSAWDVVSIGSRYASKTPSIKSAGKEFLKNIYLLRFPDTTAVPDVMRQIGGHPEVRIIEPDYRLQLFDWPSDSLFSRQWYLHNTGQEYYAIERIPGVENDTLYLTTGMPGEDVNLAYVYDNPPPDSAPVIVSIIDTGVDVEHPDLAERIFVNNNEIPDNGVDDDNNGFIDDYRGWDFSGDSLTVTTISPDNDVSDSIGHGTHVAGLAGAVPNQIGIAGYPGNIKILPVKIFPNGFVSIAIQGLIYSADMGARVLNASWGYAYESAILQEAFRYVEAAGCLPVAAAGNFGNSNPVSPADFPETFTVGGTNSDGYITYFSTYGPFVDIVAPARDILSLRAEGTDLYPDEPGLRIIADNYIIADGTSMAAPLVAGAAAMLLSYTPWIDLPRLKEILTQSADDLVDPFNQGDSLPGYDTLSGWGRLDAGAALQMSLEPSAYLSQPTAGAIVIDSVAITVTTTGGFNGLLEVEYGEGSDPGSWTPLVQIDNLNDPDSTFYWDPGSLNGRYTLRLTSSLGEYRVPVIIVGENTLIISEPAENQTYLYTASIAGTVQGSDYDSLIVSHRRTDLMAHTTLGVFTRFYFDEQITAWSVTNMMPGSYYVRLRAYFGSEIREDSVRIQIESLMRDGFPYELPGFAAFSPNTADITGDGIKEIVVGCKFGVHAIDIDGNLLDGFPVDLAHDMRSMPAFDDVDGDGLLDIIITGNNRVTCLNYRGEHLPGWPRSTSTGQAYYSYPIPVAGEFFEQEDSVITYMTKYGEVHAYKFNGDSYFYSLQGLFSALNPTIFDTSLFTGLSIPFLTATDLDYNGSSEVISIYSTTAAPSGIYIWNGRNGLAPFDWESPLLRPIRLSEGGMLADIDDDGYLEIIMAGIDTNRVANIWAIEFTGEDVPGWPVTLGDLSDWLGTKPVCADIDGDGSKEVIIAYWGLDIARIYAFRSDGTPYTDVPGNNDGVLINVPNTMANLIVADIDGDAVPNIIGRGGYVFPGQGFEHIYAWEPNGDLTPGFPIITPTPVYEVTSSFFTPVVDDLEGDGQLELLMCGDNRQLFVYNLNAPAIEEALTWPRFGGDIRNSGINPARRLPTDIDDDQAITPAEFAIDRIYPNPFNPATTIRFALDRTQNIKLIVYNILGQQVRTLADGRHQAGLYEYVWDGSDDRGSSVASGLYFARLLGDSDQVTRKMVLLK